MTAAELEALARARLRVSAPHVTDEQWTQWLAEVAARGGVVVLTLDGARGEYPRVDALQGILASDRGLR